MSYDRSDMYVYLGEEVQETVEIYKDIKKELKKKKITQEEYNLKCAKLIESLSDYYENNWDDDVEW